MAGDDPPRVGLPNLGAKAFVLLTVALPGQLEKVARVSEETVKVGVAGQPILQGRTQRFSNVDDPDRAVPDLRVDPPVTDVVGEVILAEEQQDCIARPEPLFDLRLEEQALGDRPESVDAVVQDGVVFHQEVHLVGEHLALGHAPPPHIGVAKNKDVMRGGRILRTEVDLPPEAVRVMLDQDIEFRALESAGAELLASPAHHRVGIVEGLERVQARR
jgi:hypothetical protein